MSEAEKSQRVHELKTSPEAFSMILRGTTQFEIEPGDDVRVGDTLRLREWDEAYTGRVIEAVVTDVVRSGE